MTAARIETVTFTGVDAATDPDRLQQLHSRYPRTELAVLAGGANRCRHQSLDAVAGWGRFAAAARVPMALHLCGPHARAVNTATDTAAVLELCAGFQRVQINAARYDPDRVAAFADAVGCRSVILQHRGGFDAGLPVVHPKVEYLFDRSGGRGRSCFDDWPPPPDTRTRVGYAGGMSPRNIAAALAAVHRFAQGRVWLDMETGVRTDDRLDLDKVEAVCQTVFAGR